MQFGPHNDEPNSLGFVEIAQLLVTQDEFDFGTVPYGKYIMVHCYELNNAVAVPIMLVGSGLPCLYEGQSTK